MLAFILYCYGFLFRKQGSFDWYALTLQELRRLATNVPPTNSLPPLSLHLLVLHWAKQVQFAYNLK